MKDIQRGIVGGNAPTTTATTTQQSGMNNYYFKIKSFSCDFFSK
jgi:hypothetical protein